MTLVSEEVKTAKLPTILHFILIVSPLPFTPSLYTQSFFTGKLVDVIVNTLQITIVQYISS